MQKENILYNTNRISHIIIIAVRNNNHNRFADGVVITVRNVDITYDYD